MKNYVKIVPLVKYINLVIIEICLVGFDKVIRLVSMNVDKFGHHVHKRLRLPIDFNDKNLRRQDDGDFDLKLTRLKGVKSPSFPDDAVNKQYVDQKLAEFYTKQDIDVEFKNIKSQLQVILDQFSSKHSTKNEKFHIPKTNVKNEQNPSSR